MRLSRWFGAREGGEDFVADHPPVIHENQISLSPTGETATIGTDHILLRDVMNVAINVDTVHDDGIGGSAVITTREVDDQLSLEKKKYKYTFDEAAMHKMMIVLETLKQFGVKSVESEGIDDSFRRAFF